MRKTVSEHHARLFLEVQGYEQKLASVVTKTNSAEQAMASSSKRTAQIAQQAGFQVQDFFVQVASGQSKMVALTQQLPQFLGVFGPAGALAGAAFAISAVGAQIFMTSRKAQEGTEKIKSFVDALNEATKIKFDISFNALTDPNKAVSLKNQIGLLEGKQSGYNKEVERGNFLMGAALEIQQNRSKFLFRTAEARAAFQKVVDSGMNPNILADYQSKFGGDYVSPGNLKSQYEVGLRLTEEYGAKILEIEGKRLELGQELKKINANIAKQAEEAAAIQVRMAQQMSRNASEFQTTLSKSLEKVRAKVQEDLDIQTKNNIDEALTRFFEVAPQAETMSMPKIPVNSYQRIGLGLGPTSGNTQQADSKKMISTLESIDKTLKQRTFPATVQ